MGMLCCYFVVCFGPSVAGFVIGIGVASQARLVITKNRTLTGWPARLVGFALIGLSALVWLMMAALFDK